MKRSNNSFMEENPSNNPAFSSKRSKHCGGGHSEFLECSGKERLRTHQKEVAGKVAIPESWGQEEMLKGMMDYAAFDALLIPAGLSSAREALIMEGRRRREIGNSNNPMRIENRC